MKTNTNGYRVYRFPHDIISHSVWLEEVFVNIQGRLHYLWRAVDQDGDLIDILVQRRRNARAAKRFFRKLLKGQGSEPLRLVTDKLRSYANNRAEVSHQPTRQRERLMRRFKLADQAQRFLSVHGVVQNLFRLGRHLQRAVHYRFLRDRSFNEWSAATAV